MISDGGRLGGVKQDALPTEDHNEAIHQAVVVVVGEAGTASDLLKLEISAGSGGDVAESSIVVIMQQRVLHRHHPVETPVDNENVLPAVVIVVKETITPGDVLSGSLAEARAHRLHCT